MTSDRSELVEYINLFENAVRKAVRNNMIAAVLAILILGALAIFDRWQLAFLGALLFIGLQLGDLAVTLISAVASHTGIVTMRDAMVLGEQQRQRDLDRRRADAVRRGQMSVVRDDGDS